MPEEFAVDELLYRLQLRAMIEASEQAVADGRVLSHEEAVRRSQLWLR